MARKWEKKHERAEPALELKFSGRRQLLPPDGSGFFADLTQLCRRAHLMGTVSVMVQHDYDEKGELGVHIHTPERNGVPLTWHCPDYNGVRVLLNSPSTKDLPALYHRLKHGIDEALFRDHQPTTQTRGESFMPKLPDAHATLALILGTNTSEELEPEETTASSPEVEQEAHQTEAYEPSAFSRFINDQEAIELFLLELSSKANDAGELSASDCVEILRNEFGFSHVAYTDHKKRGEYNMPYVVLATLVQQGYLTKPRRGYYVRLITQSSDASTHGVMSETATPVVTSTPELVTAQAPSAPERAVTSVASEAAPAATFTPNPASITPSDLVQRIQALIDRVDSTEAQRQRVVTLSQQEQEVALEIERLTAEHTRLVDERNQIEASLQSPEVLGDAAAFAAIQRLSQKS